MKKLLLAIICLIIGGMAFAQAPQKISYQAVIRNNSGNLVTNQQVWLRISIMKNGGTTGQIDQPISTRSIVAIYTETHTVTTNANGLATIEIGGGTTNDNFAAIDWSNGTYYLKTSVDLTGRGRYEVMGMSQLISVPYAMYAQKAGSAVAETDPQFNAWDKDYNDLTNRPEIPVVPTNVSAFTNDANYITSADIPAQVNADWNATSGAGQILNKPEIPTVPTNVSAFTNDANYITSADVPAQVNADWNATSGAGQILNKPELFSGNYNDLANKPEIPTVPTNVSAFTNDANYITSADVPAQVNADWNATSGAGQILNKPEIPTVPTNVSAFTNDANYITSADVPAQVNADWNATIGAGQILNKPAIPTVPTNVSAFTNDANYITSADVPAQVNADWNATSGAGQILNKPELFSGNYNDLTNKPAIPTVPTNVSAFTNDANYITSADVPAQVNADWNATSGAGQILNKPAIPTVPTNVSAFTNDANYITSADVPAQVNADWNATSGAGQILNKPELFSGNYNDLTNKPAIPTVPTNVSAFTNDANYITSADVPVQVNADWNATSGAGQILNKPAIPTVPTNVSAFTNDANYITSADVPAQVNADWNATSGAGQILNKPELFSGNYNDLTNKPAIPTVPTNVSAFTNDANYITSADVPAQVNADWNATSGAGQILNKPEIPTVPTNVSAFTNDANYITSADVPAQVNADWNATSGAGQILNKPEIFSGNYNDLTNKPAIPTVPTNVSAFTNDANYITSADVPAQVNADWNATSGAGQILNKPEIFSGNYNDLTNKPTIPTVPTNVSAFTNDANYITSADVPAQVNADWNATSGAGQILNKPEMFDGNYNNLTNTPDLSGFITTESQTIADAAALGNSVNAQLKNVTDPTENQDAVTKKYVDELIAALQEQNAAMQAQIAEMQATIDAFSTGQGGGNVTYTVTFNANGGTGTMNPQTFNAGEAQSFTSNTFTKENYNFTGWNTSADGNGTAYTDGQEITATADMTLYAQWMPIIAYTITFDANGGSGTMESQTFAEGEAQALTINAFTRANYTFTGWNTSADGNGTAYTDSQEIVATADMTLYAQWEIITYTVTFESNGGTGEMSPQVFNAGEEQAITSNSFTKSGYVFCGWYTTDRGAYSDGQSIVATSDMILYARWFSTEGNGTLEGYSYVDIGLPSGTKWATCNVGASTPTAYGDYFAWGETTTKTTYSWATYSLCNGTYSTLTKYCSNSNYGNNGFTDALTTLEASDDAATANWGSAWRMPTKAEFEELKSNCTVTWTTQNGVNGSLFTGPNGNSIFIPAAGYYAASTLNQANSVGHYWSSSLRTEDYAAWYLYFDLHGSSMPMHHRCYARPVRPVCSSNDTGNSSNLPQPTSYTVTFDANGGTGTMDSQTFNAGEAQTLTANTFTKENYTFAGWNTAADNSGAAYTNGQSIILTEDITLYAQWEVATTGTLNGYEWVDLGLPSGIKWATCNVGASSPEGSGSMINPRNTNYSLPSGYGSNWHVPSKTEMSELINKCTHTWTTFNGKNGMRFTGPNGNSIFLPATGYLKIVNANNQYYNGSGSFCYYRTSSVFRYSSDNYECSYFLQASSSELSIKYWESNVAVGSAIPIRPVCR